MHLRKSIFRTPDNIPENLFIFKSTALGIKEEEFLRIPLFLRGIPIMPEESAKLVRIRHFRYI
ncbi:Uncharacterized protein dnm_052150 [Desulfonema magnum]|uniref:Uncharacterized protein n=1 Tax=Desulfonema magnum TaxID=45655 RepID=A0A975BPB9_9BACT|nr:Uncharacterized protein dnm_052150 [Desulfonema magnum]